MFPAVPDPEDRPKRAASSSSGPKHAAYSPEDDAAGAGTASGSPASSAASLSDERREGSAGAADLQAQQSARPDANANPATEFFPPTGSTQASNASADPWATGTQYQPAAAQSQGNQLGTQPSSTQWGQSAPTAYSGAPTGYNGIYGGDYGPGYEQAQQYQQPQAQHASPQAVPAQPPQGYQQQSSPSRWPVVAWAVIAVAFLAASVILVAGWRQKQNTELDHSAQQQQLAQQQQDQDQREQDLNDRQSQLDQREQDLNDRQSQLDQRQSQLDQKESQLNDREQKVSEREQEAAKNDEDAVPSAPKAPAGYEYFLRGPYAAKSTCDKAAESWPSGTTECFTKDSKFYHYALRQRP